MEIIQANKHIGDTKHQISQIFVEGFYQWFKFFSKDKKKLTDAFEHMFNLDVFYIAIINGEIAGVAACTNGKTPSLKLQKKEFKKHLGFFKGSIAYAVLTKEFEAKPYPFNFSSTMSAIEFVATSIDHRRMGVAESILKHIVRTTQATEYVLEVADTNTSAIKLYEKLGFEEFLRVKEKHPKQSGINFLLYLKYSKLKDKEVIL